MRRLPTALPFAFAALAALSCRQRPEPAQAAAQDAGPPPLPVVWRAESASGKAVMVQRGDGTTCLLESTGGQKNWTAPLCAATAEQLAFVSEDGQWLLVIDPLPPVRDGRWQEAEAIWLYEQGLLKVRAPVSDLVQGPQGLHYFVGTVGWLRGTSDLEGDPPRYGPGGASVVGELADGTPFSLPFDAKPRERPRPAQPPPPQPQLQMSPEERAQLEQALERRRRSRREGGAKLSGGGFPSMGGRVDVAAILARVDEHLKAGRMTSVVEDLETLRSAYRDQPDQLRELANFEGHLALRLLNQGNPEDARRLANVGVETSPEAPRPREALGQIAYARNDLSGAISEWNRGLTSSPGDPRLVKLLSRGQVESASLKTYRTRSSEHFVLTFEQGQEDRELADLALSALEESYQKVSAIYGFKPTDQVPVVLYPAEAFSQLEAKPAWAAGIFDGKVRAGTARAISRSRDFRALMAHEYGHAVLHRATRATEVPGWFNEGLADVAKATLEPQAELTCLFGHGAKLQHLRPSFAALPSDPRKVHDAYITARHAVERLIAKKGLDAVREIIKRVGQGEPFDRAFETTTGQSYAAFVEAFDQQQH